jgi:hypothetical protein
MKRTRHGLTLDFKDGEWVTNPRGYAIGRAREVSFCEGPHPMREGKFGANHSYCPGGIEHDRECGWDVRTNTGRDACHGDLFETLNEAWAALAAELIASEEKAWLMRITSVSRGRTSDGSPLTPGVNVDAIDVEAGMTRAQRFGYDSPEHQMVIEYALMRHRRGEEDGAQRTALSGGIDLTSWYAILASAITHGSH